MSEEKINQMVLKVKNYLVDVLKYVKEEDELVYPYNFSRSFNNHCCIGNNHLKKGNLIPLSLHQCAIYNPQNIYQKLKENLKKYDIVAVDIGKYGKTEIKYLVNDKGKINTYSKFICENHYILYLSSNGERYITIQLEKPFINDVSSCNLYINWAYEFISKPFLNYKFNTNILSEELINYAIINNLLFDENNIENFYHIYDVDMSIDEHNRTGGHVRINYIIIDDLVEYDNIYDKLLLHKEKYEKKHIQIEKQLKLEKETEEKNKIVDENIKVSILDTSLKIENYYKPKINLQDYLPHKTKKFMRNSILNQIEITNITEVIFVNCNFTEITDYYEGIKIMYLTDCPNFKQIPKGMEKQLSKLFIDTEEVEFC